MTRRFLLLLLYCSAAPLERMQPQRIGAKDTLRSTIRIISLDRSVVEPDDTLRIHVATSPATASALLDQQQVYIGSVAAPVLRVDRVVGNIIVRVPGADSVGGGIVDVTLNDPSGSQAILKRAVRVRRTLPFPFNAVRRDLEGRDLLAWILLTALSVMVVGFASPTIRRLYLEVSPAQETKQLRNELSRVKGELSAVHRELAPRRRAPSAHGQVPEVPEELAVACVRGNCTLFTGLGFGAQAGYPTMPVIASRLLEQVNAEHQAFDVGSDALYSADLSSAMSVLASRLPSDTIRQHVAEMFSAPLGWLPEVAETLASIPFCGAITSGWDSLLDRTFSQRAPLVMLPGVGTTDVTLPREGRFYIAKLFGDLKIPESFLFTPDEVRRALYESPEFTKWLSSEVIANTLLFIGTSIYHIESFFAVLPPVFLGNSSHFALVPQYEYTPLVAERLEARYGVKIFGYEPSEGYPEVDQFLNRLARKIAQEGPVVRKKSVDQEVRLNHVTLTNIGSFESLSLSWDPGWNVLLGNNGSGKSTILRAIALALCGDDPRALEAAQRLLRVGARTGSVELQIGDVQYRAELIRERSRIIVRQPQLSPLARGNWVALGFPPLRGLSSRNPVGPGPGGSPNPDVADLLPLLSSQPDERIDNLKQWLVNIDVNSVERAGVNAEMAERSRQLRNSFFAVVRDLLPGSRVDFVRVDPITRDCIIRTEDGEISIDQVSQGMLSMLGWVGTLLHRLFEIHDTNPNPAGTAALVLIDEIDAHLHPEWQKALVGLVKKHFPNLQVIATTHSPLIVAGMQRENVLVARRQLFDGRSRITIEQPPMEFDGMTSDQILTSPLFGLLTTRSQTVQKQLSRKAALLSLSAQRALTPEESNELESLSLRLNRVMKVGETGVERAIEDAVYEQVANMAQNANVDWEATPEVMRTAIKEQLASLGAGRKPRATEEEIK